MPVPCRVMLCLSHTKGAAAAAQLFKLCLVWFVPVSPASGTGAGGCLLGWWGWWSSRGEPSPGKFLGPKFPHCTARTWGAAVGRGSSALSATRLGLGKGQCLNSSPGAHGGGGTMLG